MTPSNRKWHLALLILIISTIIFVVPPLVSTWMFKSKQPLVLLSGSEYVSLITLVCSGYFISNVWYKNVELKNGIDSSSITTNTNTNMIEEEEVVETEENEEEKQI